MVPEASLLVALVMLVDRLPLPPAPARRGRAAVYPERLFLQALLIMIVKPRPGVHTLLAVPDRDTPELRRLRGLLTEQGRYPKRRTRERRLKALPDRSPARSGCLGRHLVDLLDPWRDSGRAAAIDSSVLRALGGVWHRKHRAAGSISSARGPSSTSTASSRAASSASARCRPAGWWRPAAPSSAPCSSSKWPCWTASRPAATCGSGSKPP